MIKNILLITDEYPADDLEKEFTPVVHFFAKEWITQGYNVLVLDFPTNYPLLYYMGAKLIRRKLESCLGINLRTYKLTKRKYVLDAVKVLRYPLRKLRPHGSFSKKQINKGVDASIKFCAEKEFTPDVIIGHWTNPTVDIMLGLKNVYNVPCALSMHDDGFNFRSIYKKHQKEIFRQIDCWGFRSFPIKRNFESFFGKVKNSYMCFSGVPDKYISDSEPRDFKTIHNFLFVGLLMKRKHPFELVQALNSSEIEDFTLDIVGEGDEATQINKYIKEHCDLSEKIRLLGRIPRDEVSKKMIKADIFCMISENEAFGLVYIEAMAAGCITIASRNEGFDGIIKDGENGFLCEAGNVEELTAIINKINRMDRLVLNTISANAVRTANNMTDAKVAASYIKDVNRLIIKKNSKIYDKM